MRTVRNRAAFVHRHWKIEYAVGVADRRREPDVWIAIDREIRYDAIGGRNCERAAVRARSGTIERQIEIAGDADRVAKLRPAARLAAEDNARPERSLACALSRVNGGNHIVKLKFFRSSVSVERFASSIALHHSRGIYFRAT